MSYGIEKTSSIGNLKVVKGSIPTPVVTSITSRDLRHQLTCGSLAVGLCECSEVCCCRACLFSWTYKVSRLFLFPFFFLLQPQHLESPFG